MSRGEFVRHAGERARQRGIVAGMPISEARTLPHPRDRLVHESLQPERDRQELIQLALEAEQFSYRVGPEETERPESLLLDVTGLVPLFGDEQTLVERIDAWLRVRHLQGRIAIAETISQAWAAAHVLAQPHRPVLLSAKDRSVLESFPVTALRLSESIVTRLHRLGLQTVEQLLVLDRSSLPCRFGEELLRRLDQFTGLRAEEITPCRSRPRYRVAQQLDDGMEHPEAIEHLWSSLLEQLLEQLRPWQVGLRHLRGEIRLEDGSERTIDLRLCEATHHSRHLCDLLRLHWERLSLTAPLMGLSWEGLDVAPLEAAQGALFDPGARDRSQQYSMLVNRLISRLGEEAVVAPRLLPDPVPERSVCWCPVARGLPESSSPGQSGRFQGLDRPPVLFRRPRPIEVMAVAPQGPPRLIAWNSRRWEIDHAWGPERIESGWWQEAFVRRDYYRAETVTGHRLWLYQRLRDGRWFWQGAW